MENYKFENKRILRIPRKPEVISFNSREDMLSFYSNKDVQESLYIASPILYNKCKYLLSGELKNEEREKVYNSLLKYALRMCNRSTPFGLFSGCGVVSNHSFSIDESKFYRKTRLDIGYLCELIQHFNNKDYIRDNIKYYCNSSIYMHYDKYRYVEYFNKNNKRVHKTSAVDYSKYLELIFESAKNGNYISSLSQTIVDSDISYDEAVQFVNHLIDNQLLVSDLEPSVTGDGMLEDLIKKLQSVFLKSKNNLIEGDIIKLNEIKNCLEKIDLKIGNNISKYKQIISHIEKFEIAYDESKLFHIDLFFKSSIVSDKKESNDNLTIENELNQALEVLNILTPRMKNNNLNNFKEKFIKRYEERTVPLTEVLDPESGIGYSNIDSVSADINEFTDDIILPQKTNSYNKIRWHERDSFMLKKISESIKNNVTEIDIGINELKSLKAIWSDLPPTMSVMYKHHGISNNKPLLSVESVGGVSATNLISRFTSGNEDIYSLTKNIIKHEKTFYANKAIASILHLPEGRTGNVLYRKPLRDYEINYLSNYSVKSRNNINPTDLFLSFRNNRFVLYSKKHNCEVVPRLDNAHNYSRNALPLYHFLCDLQGQDYQTGLFFSWGPLQNQFSFFPRVKVGNVIIQKAKWIINKNSIKELLGAIDLEKSITTFKRKHKLPDIVILAYGDNELIIDLNNNFSINMFLKELKKHNSIVLYEYLSNKPTIVDLNDKSYSNQYVANLKKSSLINDQKEDLNLSKYTSLNRETVKIQRTFPVGSEWIYFKIYGGVKTLDRILTECITPLIRDLLNNKVITHWFFIRYSDPSMHIRLRIHISNISRLGIIVNKFYGLIKYYIDSDVISDISLETYNREIERYGNSTIEYCEYIFGHESNCTLGFLNQNPTQKEKYCFAIETIDQLLTAFNYSLESKMNLLKNLQLSFGEEFGINKGLKEQLNKKYRNFRNNIDEILLKAILGKGGKENKEIKILNKKIKPIAERILILENENDLDVTIESLLKSLIHMKNNRIFRSKQRLNELVIYYFLWKSYCSINARIEKGVYKRVINK